MDVAFSAPLGDFVIRYENALLFRDNVQHHLQNGWPSPGYPLVHAIADAPVDGEIIRLEAEPLYREVSGAFEQIRALDVGELAISMQTRVILMKTGALPLVRGTGLLPPAGWDSPVIARRALTIGELFDDFVENLGIVTDSGFARGAVHVATRAEGVPTPKRVRVHPARRG